MQITPTSLNKAHRELLKCEYLGSIIQKHGKCTLVPEIDKPFDTLISSIISQQLSLKAAATIEGRIRKLVGKTFRPTPILKASIEDLRAAGLSGRKVEYIQGISEAVKSRKLNFKKLELASDEEVKAKLIELRGVGQWTAEMFMIFVLGRIDIFSYLDVGLQRGMKQLFGEDKAHSLEAMEKLAERWQPYRSIASWYLWKVID